MAVYRLYRGIPRNFLYRHTVKLVKSILSSLGYAMSTVFFLSLSFVFHTLIGNFFSEQRGTQEEDSQDRTRRER